MAILLEGAVLSVGIDDLDEGYFAQQALRVVHGQVPYRDFDSLYTPGLLYLHAAVFGALGGPSLLGVRLVALLGRACIGGLMYVLGRAFARPAWAVAAPLFLLIALDAAPERWEPHPGWPSTALALLSVCLFPRHPLAAGGVAGLSFAFKQNTGLLVLGAAVFFAWMARGDGRAWRARVRHVVTAFAVVTLAWLLPLLVAIDGQVTRLAPFVGGVNQVALFSPPEPLDLLPIAAGALGAWYGWRRCRHPLLAWYLVAGGFLFLTEYPRMDALHLVWSAPLLLVVGAIAVDRLGAQVGVLAVATLVLAALPMVGWRTEWLGQSLARLSGVPVADGLLVPARTRDDLEGVVSDVRARTAPNEPIFVYPTSPLLYVLAERHNPTRYDHLYPGAAPPSEVQATIADLAAVRVVVNGAFWTPFFGSGGDNLPLEHYVAEHYREVARYGAYHVLERAETDSEQPDAAAGPILARMFGAEDARPRD